MTNSEKQVHTVKLIKALMVIMIMTQGVSESSLESDLLFKNKSISPSQVLRRTDEKAPEKREPLGHSEGVRRG